jgi:hypothetical protein
VSVRVAEIVDWTALREPYGEGRMPQAILYGLIGLAGLAVSATGIVLG